MEKFRVGISSDFIDTAGKQLFPSVDMRPLLENQQIETHFLPRNEGKPGGHELTTEDLAEFDAVILWTERYTPKSRTPNGRLTLLRRIGAGYEKIDIGTCSGSDVALAIARDGVRRPVAVMLLTLILAMTGKLLIKDKLARGAAATWNDRVHHMGIGLIGKTVGLLGSGNTGAELVQLLKPLDTLHIAYDPYMDPSTLRAQGIEPVSLEELFRRSDLLVVSCPLTSETHHIVNQERLALMKPDAFIINGARGGIIDQKALVKALQKGQIAGAGLDVLEKEPPDADDPILKLENVILNPHALCWTDQCFADCFAEASEGVLDVMHGRIPKNILNGEIVKNAAWLAKLDNYRRRWGEEERLKVSGRKS